MDVLFNDLVFSTILPHCFIYNKKHTFYLHTRKKRFILYTIWKIRVLCTSGKRFILSFYFLKSVNLTVSFKSQQNICWLPADWLLFSSIMFCDISKVYLNQHRNIIHHNTHAIYMWVVFKLCLVILLLTNFTSVRT